MLYHNVVSYRYTHIRVYYTSSVRQVRTSFTGPLQINLVAVCRLQQRLSHKGLDGGPRLAVGLEKGDGDTSIGIGCCTATTVPPLLLLLRSIQQQQ